MKSARAYAPDVSRAYPIHGGDSRHLPKADYLDLSTCVNRYGPPKAVIDRLHSLQPADIQLHPYEAASELRDAYATNLDVSINSLSVGRGITEFIWALPSYIDRASTGVFAPAYSEHLKVFGPDMFSQFQGEDRYDCLVRGMNVYKWVILSNPNNPTGAYFTRSEISDACACCPQSTLIIDESYMEFVCGEGNVSAIGLDVENLIVLRSVSKFYGMAATRCGVAWSNSNIHETLNLPNLTWPLSGIDVKLACTALSCTSWEIEAKEKLRCDGLWLEECLQALDIDVITGAKTHYRFFPTRSAELLKTEFQKKLIVVRSLGIEQGLTGSGLRITAPREQERDRFGAAFLSLVNQIKS